MIDFTIESALAGGAIARFQCEKYVYIENERQMEWKLRSHIYSLNYSVILQVIEWSNCVCVRGSNITSTVRHLIVSWMCNWKTALWLSGETQFVKCFDESFEFHVIGWVHLSVLYYYNITYYSVGVDWSISLLVTRYNKNKIFSH